MDYKVISTNVIWSRPSIRVNLFRIEKLTVVLFKTDYNTFSVTKREVEFCSYPRIGFGKNETFVGDILEFNEMKRDVKYQHLKEQLNEQYKLVFDVSRIILRLN